MICTYKRPAETAYNEQGKIVQKVGNLTLSLTLLQQIFEELTLSQQILDKFDFVSADIWKFDFVTPDILGYEFN